MKLVFLGLLLVALTWAACGSVNAPAGAPEMPAAPVGAGTAPPLAPTSTAAVDTIPVDQKDAPATTVPNRPMADNEATSVPAPNAPARAVPQATDRCIGPASTDSKLAPPECPPQ